MTRTNRVGVAALCWYIATIPLANWLITHVGTQPVPDGPHVIPVGFGLAAPSGVLMVGLALVLRDIVHSTLGAAVALWGIAIGVLLSVLVASPALAAASGVAFGLSELADFAVYAPLRRRHLYAAVVVSGLVGAAIDSVLFLWLAFGSAEFWLGNTLGKVWMSLAAVPFLFAYRHLTPTPEGTTT